MHPRSHCLVFTQYLLTPCQLVILIPLSWCLVNAVVAHTNYLLLRGRCSLS